MLTRTGINWNDFGVLSKTGINWNELGLTSWLIGMIEVLTKQELTGMILEY